MKVISSDRLFGFPDEVNEKAARTVACGVVLLVVSTELSRSWIPLVLLTYGFLARVATGPKLSPLGQIATRFVAPRLGLATMTAGKPKRFAQGIGASFSLVVLVLYLTHHVNVGLYLLWILGAFALMEAGLGLCVGCKIFGILQRSGIVAEVCAECNDIFSRRRSTQALSNNGE